eukprot:tig00020553_g10541.t1
MKPRVVIGLLALLGLAAGALALSDEDPFSLNRLPIVKSFINDESRQYAALEVKYIPGLTPRFVFYDAADQELHRVDIDEFNNDRIHSELQNWGLKRQI